MSIILLYALTRFEHIVVYNYVGRECDHRNAKSWEDTAELGCPGKHWTLAPGL